MFFCYLSFPLQLAVPWTYPFEEIMQDRYQAAKRSVTSQSHVRLRVQRTMRAVQHERGWRAEQKAVDALSEPFPDRPSWFRSIRLGTEEEDHEGIDVVIETKDLGKLLIQVKSSQAGVKKFVERGRRSHLIGIVVIGLDDETSVVRQKLLHVAKQLRHAILEKRGTSL